MCVTIEQVPGFCRHPHHDLALLQLRGAGYSIRWAGVIDPAGIGAATRKRWLCIATHNASDHVEFSPIQLWSPIAKTNPCSLGGILHWDGITQAKLLISDEIKQTASNPAFLPPQHRGVPGIDPFQVRINDGESPTPTFMASYGSQHGFSERAMSEKGFLGHFFGTTEWEDSVRHWHPCEIQLLHTVFADFLTPADLPKAWLQVRNQITVPHALYVLGNALNFLCKIHPKIDVSKTLQKLWDDRLSNANSQILHFPFGTKIQRLDHES